MNEEISQRLASLESKINELNESMRVMRRYFVISTILNILIIVLPLIGFAILIPFLFDVLHDISQLYSELL